MKILLIGKNGQLGDKLRRSLSERHDLIALGRDEIDLNDAQSVHDMLPLVPCVSLFINAAAYTAVDKAEHNERTAININTFAPEILAQEAKRRNIPMIHFSTDYVFDGYARRKPYMESDKPNPQSIYAKTKFGGEIAIRESWKKYLIFRTSGLYGGKNNFVATMYRLAAAGKSPSVVNDQTVSPNHSGVLASAIASIVNRLADSESLPWGTYHLSGGGSTTWHAFATEIFSHYQKTTGEVKGWPTGISTAEYGATASRPAYSVLNADLAETAFGIRLQHWKTQLCNYLRKKQVQ